jgi:hypothetical protein
MLYDTNQSNATNPMQAIYKHRFISKHVSNLTSSVPALLLELSGSKTESHKPSP